MKAQVLLPSGGVRVCGRWSEGMSERRETCEEMGCEGIKGEVMMGERVRDEGMECEA